MTMNRLPRTFRVTCPYCGNRNAVLVDNTPSGPRVVLCDVDDSPGCDRYFAVDIKLNPTFTVYRMIEEAA